MKAKPLVLGVEKPVSELVLGSAWFSQEQEEEKEKEQCFDLMDNFVAFGGTAIDTARCYGESERVIGEWMARRGNRERIFLITKGGLSDKYSSRLAVEGMEDKVDRDIEISLECLQTDYIDLYFLHRDDVSIPVGRIVECLNGQLERGRIRAFGGSNWEYARVDEANDYADKHGLVGFSAVSNNLSLAKPTGPFYPGLVSVDEAGERWHTETAMPLFSWSSLARGFFTGGFRWDMWDRVASSRDASAQFARRMLDVYGTDENFERLSRAGQLGESKGGYSAIEVALAWLLHQPFIVLPIVGPRTIEELTSCVRALDINLTESERRWLDLRTYALASS